MDHKGFCYDLCHTVFCHVVFTNIVKHQSDKNKKNNNSLKKAPGLIWKSTTVARLQVGLLWYVGIWGYSEGRFLPEQSSAWELRQSKSERDTGLCVQDKLDSGLRHQKPKWGSLDILNLIILHTELGKASLMKHFFRILNLNKSLFRSSLHLSPCFFEM